jgi:quercetin dioxygenase-like cupin family protein
MKRTFGIVVGVGIMLALGACSGEDLPPVSSRVLLDKADTTVLGDGFSYPGAENPEITSSIVRLEAGAETGWHLHEAPMYAYILDGTLEVTYDVDGAMVTKTYHQGDAIMEGLDFPHMGKNLTNRPVSILVVNIGSSDLANSVPLDAPEQ